MQNYNGTWQHQIITDQIKSEVVNDMHPVNNGGILETQCRKGKHYFLYAKYYQSYTYHHYVLNFFHFKFRGLITCITGKKKNRSYV